MGYFNLMRQIINIISIYLLNNRQYEYDPQNIGYSDQI